jgi:hypothetical protein
LVGNGRTHSAWSDGRVDAYGVRWQTKCDTALTFGTTEVFFEYIRDIIREKDQCQGRQSHSN